jgi:hypothetical protein
MQLLFLALAPTAIMFIYMGWRIYSEYQERRQQVLRERVTYMLWVMSNEFDLPNS